MKAASARTAPRPRCCIPTYSRKSFTFTSSYTRELPGSRGCYMESKRARWTVALLFSFSAMVVSGLTAVLAGSHHLDLARALRGVSPDHEILIELRLPRALLALWTGGALSLSGVLFQAL